MAYFIGSLVGAFLVIGLFSAIIKRFWKRPMLAPIATGLLATVLTCIGSGGEKIRLQYVVAGAIWGGIWSWRAKKNGKVTDTSPPAAAM